MSTEPRDVHQSPREIRFAHAYRTGWVVAVVGTLVCAFGLVGVNGSQEWAVVGFGVLFLLGGVLSALYRLELTLDLARRRYRYRRGFIPMPREGGGSIDEIEAVALDSELESRDGERMEEWEVELVLKNWMRPVELSGIWDEARSHSDEGGRGPVPDSSLRKGRPD